MEEIWLCVVGSFKQIEILAGVFLLYVFGANVGGLLCLAVDFYKSDFSALYSQAAIPVTAFDVPCSSCNIVGFVHSNGGVTVDKDGNGRQGYIFVCCAYKGEDAGNVSGFHNGDGVAIVFGFGSREGNRFWYPGGVVYYTTLVYL